MSLVTHLRLCPGLLASSGRPPWTRHRLNRFSPFTGLNVAAMAQAGSNEFTQLSQSLAGV